MTVGFKTMGLGDHGNLKPYKWDLGAMKLRDKANADHMSLGLKDLGLMGHSSKLNKVKS